MTSLAHVFELYARWGWHQYDEALPQVDHALQTAAHAETSGATDELVAAALLHDIGHLLALDGEGRPGPHEETGAAYLAQLFPTRVTAPVALHVRAKRYLCAVEAGYAATLSAGSVRSLERQGGPMNPEEIEALEATEGWADAVALRRWDDTGKASMAASRTFESYGTLLASVSAPGV